MEQSSTVPQRSATQARPSQERPSQDQLREHTREFGQEANRVDSLSDRSDRLADAINRLIPIIERIDGNGNHEHSHQPVGEPNWPYAGIDTARDHKLLGTVITRLERSMMQLEGAILMIEPAILRLEGRFAQLTTRIEFALSRIQPTV